MKGSPVRVRASASLTKPYSAHRGCGSRWEPARRTRDAADLGSYGTTVRNAGSSRIASKSHSGLPSARQPTRVAERADRDDDEVRLRRLGVEDLRAAVGAEVEDVLLAVGLVGHARVVAEAAADLHLLCPESGLHPEGAARAALAGEAVADRDGERVARHLESELAAVTGGFAGAMARTLTTDPGARSETIVRLWREVRG